MKDSFDITKNIICENHLKIIHSLVRYMTSKPVFNEKE